MDLQLEFEPTKEDILILREWISKMPHIVQDYDDYALSALIRASKGRLERAKMMLENHSSLGYRFPKMFGHLDPLKKATQCYLNSTYLLPLPKRIDNGTIIYILAPIKDKEIDLTDFDIHEFPRVWQMTYLVTLWEKTEGNAKGIVIIDCEGERLARIKSVTPSFIRDSLQVLDAFPVRLQALHFVNVPSFLEPMINTVKGMMKNKMAKRFHFHSNFSTLHDEIPKKFLPEEYGGGEASVRTLHDAWKAKIESYRNRLIDASDKMRALDPLRPKLEEKEREQELHGTFRQLLID